MKIKFNLFLIIGIAIILTSCTTTFYQVYDTSSVGDVIKKDNYLIYEDDNCRVTYDLWNHGGDIGFRFYNKTDKSMYLNLEESHFVFNGMAYDYFQARSFSNSYNSATTVSEQTTASKSDTGVNLWDMIETNRVQISRGIGIMSSHANSISYLEKNIISIPPKTSKIITEFNINHTIYRDCDLLRYPKKSEVKTKTFSMHDSPIVFSNRIAYSIGDSDVLTKFENEFYVSEISNYPEKSIIENRKDEFCEQKSMTSRRFFKDASPSKFYIKYLKKGQGLKH